jgi:hypothetical protein
MAADCAWMQLGSLPGLLSPHPQLQSLPRLIDFFLIHLIARPSQDSRLETQTNIHDWRDFAPRAAVAWALGGNARGSRPKTVLRARLWYILRSLCINEHFDSRSNGVVQQQEVISNPDFFPNIPSSLPPNAIQSSQVVQEVSSRFRAPYILQSAVTLERQLPANTTLAVTYTNSHGVHICALRISTHRYRGLTIHECQPAVCCRWGGPARCS